MEWASFGPMLTKCRCAYVPELTACCHALVLGDGDGRFTARLLTANPTLIVDAVDASLAMLHSLVRRSGPHSARVRTHLADARRWSPAALHENPPIDLIASHFFLDCLTTDEVQSLAERMRGAVSPSALWLVSEFAVPPTWFGRLVARPVVSGLYLVFAWLTGLAVRSLPDHATALRQSGFTLQKRRAWLGGLLISELWHAAQTLQAAEKIVPEPTSEKQSSGAKAHVDFAAFTA
jgi:hypothetical protein